MPDHNQLSPFVARVYDEWQKLCEWYGDDDESGSGSCMRSLIYALILAALTIAVLAALIAFVMWVLR